MAQRVGTRRDTIRGWVVSSTPRPHFTPGKDPVPISQEAGWAPGAVWTGGKSRPHRDSIPDRPARSQPLYPLSYQEHVVLIAFLRQQWLCERALVLRYTYVACLALTAGGSELVTRSVKGRAVTCCCASSGIRLIDLSNNIRPTDQDCNRVPLKYRVITSSANYRLPFPVGLFFFLSYQRSPIIRPEESYRVWCV